MIIECKNCSTRFNLNEMRLKPNGSKVRCTKCGNIFIAVPPAFSHGELKSELAVSTQKAVAPTDRQKGPPIERRKHRRIPVSVPVSCIPLDPGGNPLNFCIGRITDASQEGLAIEIFCSSISDRVLVSFINMDNDDLQIKCKVAHSKAYASGKRKIGLSLVGTSQEIDNFVAHLVKSHHYSS